jgi:hypothetical protein
LVLVELDLVMMVVGLGFLLVKMELHLILEHQLLQLPGAVVVQDPTLLVQQVVLVVVDLIGLVLEHLEEQAILHQLHLHKVILVELVQVQTLAAAAVVVPVVLALLDPHQALEMAELVFNYQEHLEILYQQ